MITTLDQIVDRVKGTPTKRLAVAVAEDPHTIEAVGRAVKEKLVKATLTGDEKAINKVAAEAKVDPKIFEILHEPDKAKALALAIDKVRAGEADFLMKGLLDSSLYIRGIIDKEKGLLPPGKLLSHVTVIQAPAWKKLIICGDVAVIPAPDLEAKIAILNYAIDVAHKLGIEKPKAVLLSAVEKVNPKMPSTTESGHHRQDGRPRPDQGRHRRRAAGPGRRVQRRERQDQGTRLAGRRRRRHPGLSQHRGRQHLLQGLHLPGQRGARRGRGRARPARAS